MINFRTFHPIGSLVDHIDPWGIGEGKMPPVESPIIDNYKQTGDRIGTFMGWLTDTIKGGATCFTSNYEGRTVLPIKGAGLFWINNYRSHKRDYRLLHGGCPVLLGSKNIVNNWIYSYDQWKLWKCGTDINSEFDLFNHFISIPHKMGYKLTQDIRNGGFWLFFA